MNLHALVSGVIAAVNPMVDATLLHDAGSYSTDAAGKRTPTYATTTGQIQVQSASGKDIERVNNLGIQGVMRSIHLSGYWRGIVRADHVGGDILQFPEDPGGAVRSWKVAVVAETWADWSRVIVVLQTT
jgi:hypothetical protein